MADYRTLRKGLTRSRRTKFTGSDGREYVSTIRGAAFTPSYPARTRDEYLQMVAEGDKRDEHLMVASGRTGLRYGQGPSKRTRETQDVRRRRWKDQTPPYDARTQAVKTRAVLNTRRDALEDRIAEAIVDYQLATGTAGQFFAVPDTPFPLLKFGMPKKAANILVRRASRAVFLQPPILDVPVEEKLAAALAGQDLELTLARPRRGAEPQLGVIAQGSTGIDFQPLVRVSRMEEGRFVRMLGPRQIQGMTEIPQDFGATERVRFDFGDLLSDELTRVEVDLSAGGHSKFGSTAVPSRLTDYRNLRGVSYNALPAVLARLSRRTSRRKDRSRPPVARTNPVDSAPDQGIIELVQESIKARRLVDVPGTPGMVYWYSKRKGLRSVPRGQAVTWLAIAKTGASAKETLRKDALSAYGDTPLLLTSGDDPDQLTVRENPMPSDDYYFRRQYKKGAYGSSRSLPAARRNGKRRKARANPQAKAAMELYHSGKARSLKEAWRMVKGGRSNPGQGRKYTDRTALAFGTALANGSTVHYAKNGQPYIKGPDGRTKFISHDAAAKLTRSNPRQGVRRTKSDRFVPGGGYSMGGIKKYEGQAHFTTHKGGGRKSNWPAALYRRGQFSTSETGGFQPINRRNPGHGGVKFTRNGQPYITLPNGKCRFISKDEIY